MAPTQFEIWIEDALRFRETAIDAARFLQQHNSAAQILVTDLRDGSAVPFEHELRHGAGPSAAAPATALVSRPVLQIHLMSGMHSTTPSRFGAINKSSRTKCEGAQLSGWASRSLSLP